MHTTNVRLAGHPLVEWWPFFVSLAFFLAMGCPGGMQFDSYHQYNSALTAQYSDHHPFVMSFVWHYADMIVSGPLLMFLYNVALLYGSLAFLMLSLPWSWRFPMAVLPLLPPVLHYGLFVLKDVTYAFSFLFVLSVLAYKTVADKRLSWKGAAGLMICLLYGTMVKYQAQFLAPFVLGWMALHQIRYRWTIKLPFLFSLYVVLFYGGLHLVSYVGPPVQKNHSWQAVKIFDLVGMSVRLDQMLLPQEVAGKADLAVLKKTYEPWAVDPLWKVLGGVHSQDVRDNLLAVWKREVVHHPIAYVQHRAGVMWQMILPEKRIQYYAKKYQGTEQRPFYHAIKPFVWTIEIFFTHAGPILLLSLACLVLAVLRLGKTRFAWPLFFFQVTGLSMAAVLFCFSMAGVVRYVYITTCLCLFSLPFALMCLRKP